MVIFNKGIGIARFVSIKIYLCGRWNPKNLNVMGTPLERITSGQF